MTLIVYPSSLPVPSAAPVQSVDRRVLGGDQGPFEARTVQRDRLAVQSVTFPPFTRDQAEVFDAWWRDTLVRGGAWFAASWPLPQGSEPVARRFIGPPTWRLDSGYWRVSATMEVRGRGLDPALPPPTLPIWLWLRGLDTTGGGLSVFSDSSTNHRIVNGFSSAVLDPTITTAPGTGGCIDLTAGSAHLGTDPCPLFLGRWTIRAVVRLTGLTGNRPLLFQDADFTGSDATPRPPLSVVITPLSAVGGVPQFEVIASGYSNSNGNAWSNSASIVTAEEWLTISIERDATGTYLSFDGVLVSNVAHIDGVGGPFYITPVLRGGLLIGDSGTRVGAHTYLSGRIGEVYIDTDG